MVVRDPANGFTANAGQTRDQLTSSVDLLPMIVSMGYGGETGWMTNDDDYLQLYGNRCDLLAILGDASAPGRTYALHSTDEVIPAAYNYLDAPLHVIGLITMDHGNKSKLGVYTEWAEYYEGQSQANVLYPTATIQAPNVEFYDGARLQTALGQPVEVESTPTSAGAQQALKTLYGDPINEILGLLAFELQAPPPAKYQEAQRRAYHKLQDYIRFVDGYVPASSCEDTDVGQQRLVRAMAV